MSRKPRAVTGKARYLSDASSKRFFAFVLMPFAKEFDDVYKIGIKDAASETELEAERVDYQKYKSQTILERIQDQIVKADIMWRI